MELSTEPMVAPFQDVWTDGPVRRHEQFLGLDAVTRQEALDGPETKGESLSGKRETLAENVRAGPETNRQPIRNVCRPSIRQTV